MATHAEDGGDLEGAQILILTPNDGNDAARELFEILCQESWCHPAFRSIDEPGPVDVLPGAVYVVVDRNSDLVNSLGSTLHNRFPASPLVFTNFFSYPSPCLDLLKAGFDDFLAYPLQAEDVVSCLRSLWARREHLHHTEAERQRSEVALELTLRDLVGVSSTFNRVIREIRILAGTDAAVLIMGETGTGKDMCARAIHYSSLRAGKPFLPINCGAIPNDLFENELFGHESGAFTDARTWQGGAIRAAEGGTLFLDEVESLSLVNQAKLLRFMQGNEFVPLGRGRPLKANVRTIAATNADLLERVKQQSFREDLYFRLEVLKLSLPPLRERNEDIPSLASYLVTRFCRLYGKPGMTISEGAMRRLSSCQWPGNVRQLENVLHRAVVHASSTLLEQNDMDLQSAQPSISCPTTLSDLPFDQAKEKVVSQFESEYARRLLQKCGGNITHAAKEAGKPRRTFWEIMRRNNLSSTDLR